MISLILCTKTRDSNFFVSVERRLSWLFGEVSKLRFRLIGTSCAKRKSPDFHIEKEYGKQSFPSNRDVVRDYAEPEIVPNFIKKKCPSSVNLIRAFSL